MLTLTSSQAQNSFGTVLDTAQREMVSVTRRGEVVSLVMSPDILEGYIEHKVNDRLASQAQNIFPNTMSEQPIQQKSSHKRGLPHPILSQVILNYDPTEPLSTDEWAENDR